jgi:uncharacterized membrane-anchored protein
MSAAKKLLIAVAIQLLLLFAIIGFKQYTVLTGETVLLKTAPIDPMDLIRGEYLDLQYEISSIDCSIASGDAYYGGDVFVELQRGDDRYWNAIAMDRDRRHTASDTVLIGGFADGCYGDGGRTRVKYGIEQVFIPEGSASELPRGSGHTVAVEVKVDRFGNAVPRRFVVDGQPFDLHRK